MMWLSTKLLKVKSSVLVNLLGSLCF